MEANLTVNFSDSADFTIMNSLRTGILMAAMTGLFLAIGFFIGGTGGMVIALLIAIAMNAFAYWNADKMVLRMYNARQANDPSQK